MTYNFADYIYIYIYIYISCTDINKGTYENWKKRYKNMAVWEFIKGYECPYWAVVPCKKRKRKKKKKKEEEEKKKKKKEE